ncbi:MAG TPA: signal peptidase I [Gemmatimonadaceae bacterium]|jgi:signal peptidase I|nr:signal peptidase I [Gemmatimonadaceae bacterium]
MSANESVSVPVHGDETVADSPVVGGQSARSITPTQRMEALRELNRQRSGLDFVWEWTKILAVSVVLFALIRTFLVEAFKIPSGSMENTLQVGDFLLVNKLVYGAEVPFTHKRLPRLREPRRGDVIVFEYPVDLTKNFVKRLVGLPGDTLEMRNGTLIRNGIALSERYVEHTEPDIDPGGEDFVWQRNYVVRTANAASAYHPSRNNWGPIVVPQEKYFVLGDNRDNSLDSRYWGFVPDSLVKGRPFVIYYSYAPDTVDTFAWLTHIRWTRLGERIR